ncbi:hypothetical protein K438DRAFT_2100142 [Mycena galopus ATCC 62051]|nr:hypothetical protein K438DRAFT_2100142 [Mycena galopus ATCC 62051]
MWEREEACVKSGSKHPRIQYARSIATGNGTNTASSNSGSGSQQGSHAGPGNVSSQNLGDRNMQPSRPNGARVNNRTCTSEREEHPADVPVGYTLISLPRKPLLNSARRRGGIALLSGEPYASAVPCCVCHLAPPRRLVRTSGRSGPPASSPCPKDLSLASHFLDTLHLGYPTLLDVLSLGLLNFRLPDLDPHLGFRTWFPDSSDEPRTSHSSSQHSPLSLLLPLLHSPDLATVNTSDLFPSSAPDVRPGPPEPPYALSPGCGLLPYRLVPDTMALA